MRLAHPELASVELLVEDLDHIEQDLRRGRPQRHEREVGHGGVPHLSKRHVSEAGAVLAEQTPPRAAGELTRVSTVRSEPSFWCSFLTEAMLVMTEMACERFVLFCFGWTRCQARLPAGYVCSF